MLDNATNNDTMVAAIERRAHAESIEFNAQWARLRCMPHTIHLAAVKVSTSVLYQYSVTNMQTQLLEAIGAISKSDANKSSSRAGNYQETTSVPLERAHDEEAASLENSDVSEELIFTTNISSQILPAIDKVISRFVFLTQLANANL